MSRSVEQRWQRAKDHLARMELAPARVQLEVMRAQAPGDVRTHLLASQLAWRDDHVREAAHAALAAGLAMPDQPELLCEVVEALLQSGEVVAARGCLARLDAVAGDAPGWFLPRADFRSRLHEYADALSLYRKAAAVGQPSAELHFQVGLHSLFTHGPSGDAERELELCLHSDPTLGRAAYPLSRMRVQTAQDNHLEIIEAGLQAVAGGSYDQAALAFARYKTLEDLGRFEEAWDALAFGNAVMHRRNPWNAAGHRQLIDGWMAACGDGSLQPVAGARAGPQPIFILGLPRSGTTVLERMLANHSRVATAGELTDFARQLHWVAGTREIHGGALVQRVAQLDCALLGQRYLAQTQWHAGAKPYFIDKMPANWMYAGLIRAALPHAKILHLVRDPMDVCFGNFRTYFGDTCGFSYDFESLASFHADYSRMMEHWHASMPGGILDVPYADLVRTPEPLLRKVLDFCGLDWQPDCTDIQRTKAAVATLSAVQVRQPLHQRAFREWQPYATRLGDLRRGLDLAGSPSEH